MKWISVLVFFGLVFCVEAFYDGRCTYRGGRCKYTSMACLDGRFVSGLCSGPRNRRCCLPSSPGGGNSGSGYNDAACTDRGGSCSTSCPGGMSVRGMCGGPSNRRCCFTESSPCSDKQKALACQLLNAKSTVRAAKSHPSKQQDKAYAYNNLKDMCDGKKAARSSYRCNSQCSAPGGSVCLSLNLLNYLVALTNTGIVQINELAGACHSCKSRHYSGLAADLHKIPAREGTYINECTRHHGRPIPEKNHIHCQFYDGPHPFFQN